MIELLKREYYDIPHPVLRSTYIECVGEKANVFLSFAYSSDFTELVNAVECYMERNPSKSSETTYFWFDLFVNDQWNALDKDFDWWATTFREAVQDIGETLLILLPWSSPIMLTRAWCLYEICCSRKVSIGVSKNQVDSFYEMLRAGSHEIMAAIGKIDLENASSYLPEDKERIFAVVRGFEGGFHSFNVKVTGLLHEWAAEIVKSLADKTSLKRLPSAGKEPSPYDTSRAHVPDQLLRIRDILASGVLMMQQGKVEDSIKMFQNIIETVERDIESVLDEEEKFGLMEAKLCSQNNLGIIYRRLNRPLDSLEILQKTLKERELRDGFNCQQTIEVAGSVSNTLYTVGRFSEAKEMMKKVLHGKARIHGKNHSSYYIAMYNLANTIADQGGFEEGINLYKEAIKGFENVDLIGKFYIDCIHNIAAVYSELWMWNDAMSMLQRALKLSEVKLGENNPLTLEAMLALGGLQLKLGQYENGKNLLQRGLKRCEQTLSTNEEIAFTYHRMKAICEAARPGVDDEYMLSLSLEQEEVSLETVNTSKAMGTQHYKKAQSFEKMNDTEGKIQAVSKCLRSAIIAYERSFHQIKALEKNNAVDQAVETKETKLAVSLNLAQCFLKLENWDKAFFYCNLALSIDSTNAKALFRRACAYDGTKQWEKALADLQLAHECNPPGEFSNLKAIAEKEKKIKDVIWKGSRRFTESQIEAVNALFNKARNLTPSASQQFTQAMREQLQGGDNRSLNRTWNLCCYAVGIDPYMPTKPMDKMTIAELRGSIKLAELESAASGLTKKDDLINILLESKKEIFLPSPEGPLNDDDTMVRMSETGLKDAKFLESQGRLKEAKELLHHELGTSEAMQGLTSAITAELAFEYARLLVEFEEYDDALHVLFSLTVMLRATNNYDLVGKAEFQLSECLERMGSSETVDECIAIQSETARSRGDDQMISFLPECRGINEASLKKKAEKILVNSPDCESAQETYHAVMDVITRCKNGHNYMMLDKSLEKPDFRMQSMHNE